MEDQARDLIIGSLLHDYGKCVYRANLGSGEHSFRGEERLRPFKLSAPILEGIRLHHKGNLTRSTVADDSLAYLVYYADNISAGTDRRPIEGADQTVPYDKSLPLASIFNLLPGDGPAQDLVYPPTTLAFEKGIPFPQKREGAPKYEPSFYNKLIHQLEADLKGLDFTDPAYLNSLLSILEGYWSYLPSSTSVDQASDVSLYDHAKITAALASTTLQYLTHQGETNYKARLLDHEKDMYDIPAYLMVKLDISGIQSFIYTTSSSDALKNLRARSLYLELLTEHFCDEILQACQLSRANLIYSGGGQAYLLVSHTPESIQALEACGENFKTWLIKYFGIDLALLLAWTPCTANHFMDKDGTYKDISSTLEKILQEKKIQRYTPEDIRQLNSRVSKESDRECKTCHRVEQLIEDEDGMICTICANLWKLAREVVKEKRYFVLLDRMEEAYPVLPLPGPQGQDLYLHLMDYDTAYRHTQAPQGLIRIYSKNTPTSGLKFATNLWVGEAFYPSPDGKNQMSSFADLARAATGIQRIGSLRADIDNLGQVFSRGFRHYTDDQGQTRTYTTLSRVATLSRSLSIFFKHHVNTILRDPQTSLPFSPHSLTGQPVAEVRKANVIYAGGDDLFIVGAWDDLLGASQDIQEAFVRYSGHQLTLSAGLGFFKEGYPLIRMAYETGDLEDLAKTYRPEKNALALFSPRTSPHHIYPWPTLQEEVLQGKLQFLMTRLGQKNSDKASFSYQIMLLLSQGQDPSLGQEDDPKTPPINIARLAYLLARHQKTSKKKISPDFSAQIYQWALNPKDRAQLVTALYLYTYLQRS